MNFCRALVIAVVGACGSAPAGAEVVRIYSGGAPQIALRAMAPEFQKTSGHQPEFTFALVTEIQKKLGAGEKADLVLLPLPLLNAVENTIPWRTEGRTTIARVGIAVIVREGAQKPDLSSSEAVKQVLVSARSIAMSEPTTPNGSHLRRVIAQLGIEDAVKPKIMVKPAIDGGGELVAKGEAEVGMYLLSEVHTIKGITVAGLLPAPLQNFVVYGSAIPVSTTAADAAASFVKFITSEEKQANWTQAGFEQLIK